MKYEVRCRKKGQVMPVPLYFPGEILLWKMRKIMHHAQKCKMQAWEAVSFDDKICTDYEQEEKVIKFIIKK